MPHPKGIIVFMLTKRQVMYLLLRNLLLGEKNELCNRNMHISGTFYQNVDIQSQKMDIEDDNVDIQNVLAEKCRDYAPRTKLMIIKMFHTFGEDTVF